MLVHPHDFIFILNQLNWSFFAPGITVPQSAVSVELERFSGVIGPSSCIKDPYAENMEFCKCQCIGGLVCGKVMPVGKILFT